MGVKYPAMVGFLLLAMSFSARADDVVIQLWSEDQAQINWLRENYDVWTRDRHSKAWLVRVSEDELDRLRALNLYFVIDQQRTIDLNAPLPPPTRAGADSISGFPCYRTVEKTFIDLQNLAASHSNLAEWRDIGDSWRRIDGASGFDIFSLVLTNQARPGPKPVFLIIAAIHAREYATAELATRFAEQLVNGYGSDADITWLLDYSEIHIVPQLNPDGRDIAEVSATRFKRKNDDEDFCATDVESRGVDLNRNSSVLWGGSGSGTSQCGDTFRGPSAASEPETQAIENYMNEVFNDQRPGSPTDLNMAAPVNAEGMFISIHSFGELVLFPWEGVPNNSGNHFDLRTLARKLAFFNDYAACQDCLSPAAGTTVDYAYGEFGVAAYTFEIGTRFFETCSHFESTVLPDNLAALMFAAKSTRRPYQTPGAPEATNLRLSSNVVESGAVVTLTATISDDRRRLQSDDNGEPADLADTIIAAQYTIDSPAFAGGAIQNMQAQDSNFNNATESVTALIDTTTLSPGRHIIFVQGEDAGGIGSPSAIFLEVVDNEWVYTDSFETQP